MMRGLQSEKEKQKAKNKEENKLKVWADPTSKYSNAACMFMANNYSLT